MSKYIQTFFKKCKDVDVCNETKSIIVSYFIEKIKNTTDPELVNKIYTDLKVSNKINIKHLNRDGVYQIEIYATLKEDSFVESVNHMFVAIVEKNTVHILQSWVDISELKHTVMDLKDFISCITDIESTNNNKRISIYEQLTDKLFSIVVHNFYIKKQYETILNLMYSDADTYNAKILESLVDLYENVGTDGFIRILSKFKHVIKDAENFSKNKHKLEQKQVHLNIFYDVATQILQKEDIIVFNNKMPTCDVDKVVVTYIGTD